MWKIVKLVDGMWQQMAEEKDVNQATARAAPSIDNDIFIFPNHIESDQEEEILSAVNRINAEKIIRVTFGVSVQKVEGLSSCPGNCFCVIANGQRRCETQYCNESGWCWWVSCGYSC